MLTECRDYITRQLELPALKKSAKGSSISVPFFQGINRPFVAPTHTEKVARQVPSDSITCLSGSNPIIFQAH